MKAIEMFNTMTAEEIADTIVKKIDSFTDEIPYAEFIRVFAKGFDGLSGCPFECTNLTLDKDFRCVLPRSESCPFGRNRSEVRRKCIIRWLNKEV